MEFSHRGEVLQILEYPKKAIKWSFDWAETLQESVFSDEKGLVYRIRHVTNRGIGEIEQDTVEIHETTAIMNVN